MTFAKGERNLIASADKMTEASILLNKLRVEFKQDVTKKTKALLLNEWWLPFLTALDKLKGDVEQVALAVNETAGYTDEAATQVREALLRTKKRIVGLRYET